MKKEVKEGHQLRTNKCKWPSFLLLLMLTMLAGCTSSSRPASPSGSPSAAPGSLPSSTLSPIALPFDQGGVNYAITPGSAIDIPAPAPVNQVDADYFANETTGWLLIETEKRKMTLAHTNNGGSTWRNQKMAGEHGEAVFFQDEKHGYVMVSSSCGMTKVGVEHCGQEKLLYTLDGGNSWKESWNSYDKETAFTKADFAKLTGAAGFALTDRGTVLKTLDQGKTWKPLTIGPHAFRVEHMSFVTPLSGWVVGTSELKPAQAGATITLQVWKTVDGGQHWSRQYEQNGTALGSSGVTFYDEHNGYFAISDIDAMRGQLMRTIDGGAHWQKTSDLRPSRPTPMGIRLLSASEGWIPLDMGAGPIDGGLLHFTNGGTNTGMIPSGLWDLRDAVPTGNGTGWALAYGQPDFRMTVLRTTDEGKSWRQVWPAPHPTTEVFFFDDQFGYGIGRESEPGSFMKTDDRGVTWQVVSDLGNAGYRMYFEDKKHGWVLGTREGGTKPLLMETQDGGSTWRVDTDSLPGWESLPQVMEMKFFNHTEGLMIVQAARELRILRTKDGGKSWTADTPISDMNEIATFTILSPQELLETSLQSMKDKTTWLQLSRLTLGDGSKSLLGKWNVKGEPIGALYPSQKVGAVITPIWKENKMTIHLLRTLDGGHSWSDGEFPAKSNADISMTGRVGSYADTKWWLLIQGHLLRTSDAGQHWMIAY
jgi:photosystem II stability/assembly factor-like uncharacterized protein